jgi:CRP-like cAMP-binding protein
MSHITNTEVILPHSLSAEARRQLIDSLYAVHRRIFDGVSRESFARYVVESKAEHTWLLLHKNEAGEVVGYFALHLFEKQLGDEPLAVFRAEAGLLREYRGGNVNARFWMQRVARYVLRHPGRRVFYMGSLVHPSSYWLFARHCGEVWPRRDQETPPELLAFMDTLATEFGLEKVHAARPLVRKVGWRTRETEVERDYWAHCEKPEVRYFLEANPGYGEGHGLVTLVPITLGNLRSMAWSLLTHRMRQPVEQLAARVQHTRLGARLSAPQVVQQLRRVPYLAHLDEATLRGLAERAERLVLPAGRYVFHAGSACDELYVLERGAVYVLAEGEKLVDELGSGTVFGEGALLTGERRAASIRTATASTLVRISHSALLPLLEGDARLREGMWKTLAERRFDDMVRGSERYGHLGRKDRLALLREGEHRELAPRELQELEAGTQLFVLSGTVDVEHEGLVMTQRGSTYLETRQPLRMKARESTRLFLLKQEAARRDEEDSLVYLAAA